VGTTGTPAETRAGASRLPKEPARLPEKAFSVPGLFAQRSLRLARLRRETVPTQRIAHHMRTNNATPMWSLRPRDSIRCRSTTQVWYIAKVEVVAQTATTTQRSQPPGRVRYL